MNDHVAQDWPADPENEELARLAEQLQDAVAPLPPEALARVEQRMGAELDRAARSSRRRYLALGWSVAAAILIAIGGYAYLRSHSDGAAPHVNASPVVEDRIMIAVSGAATTTEKPLVRLDEYRSLFTD